MTLAPELPRGLQWLNAPATTLHEQRGRIVALAFVNSASAWCAQRLARYAIPRRLVVLPDLPRSQVGKVLRRVVREAVMAMPKPPTSKPAQTTSLG